MQTKLLRLLSVSLLLLIAAGIYAQPGTSADEKLYRPRIHFSPKSNWINDPNGMAYYKGVYHLFYQYYPDKPVWGPMHWGHATSRDLIHWKHLPIALYPDSLGYIFSGSAVADIHNTSGFGNKSGKGKIPLVAIFTHHDPKTEGRTDFQNQSLAYSLDEGNTWIKYPGNPVLKNPGIIDFRDPKVMWYEEQKKWIMTLATKDCISFYSSPDLKNWAKESEFGKTIGAHGGVWECPDLFALDDNGKKVWVLIINLNPGGPNGGSSTQYFLGDFNGSVFTPFSTATKWLDYGPDNYAGITWSNTGKRKIFIGWMSNWLYANEVPTQTWRNALTIPRSLSIKHAGKEMLISSQPVKELSAIQSKPVLAENITIKNSLDIATKVGKVQLPCRINLVAEATNSFSFIVSNEAGEQVVIGYDKTQNQYYIDRTHSGITGFNKEFAAKHIAPRFINTGTIKMTLVYDVSSVELFADDGLTVMTAIFFPNSPYDKIQVQSADGITFKRMEYAALKSILF